MGNYQSIQSTNRHMAPESLPAVPSAEPARKKETSKKKMPHPVKGMGHGSNPNISQTSSVNYSASSLSQG
jgi:hypothetical protein